MGAKFKLIELYWYSKRHCIHEFYDIIKQKICSNRRLTFSVMVGCIIFSPWRDVYLFMNWNFIYMSTLVPKTTFVSRRFIPGWSRQGFPCCTTIDYEAPTFLRALMIKSTLYFLLPFPLDGFLKMRIEANWRTLYFHILHAYTCNESRSVRTSLLIFDFLIRRNYCT